MSRRDEPNEAGETASQSVDAARTRSDGDTARLTSRDVAALSGVSQSTVSRVLRGYPHVSDKARDRVLRALEVTGYVPNAAARTMRTRSAGTIGVVVGRVTNPFYPQLLDALSVEIDEVDRQMALWISDHGGEYGALNAIRQGSVDGVIYTTVTADSTSLPAALRLRAPIVLLNRTLSTLPCDKVSSDNHKGGAGVAAYLLRHGHERLALVGAPMEISTGREREEGYRQALLEAGRPLSDDMFVRGEFSHATGHAAVTELLKGPRPPTGIFCVNDVIAFGALDAARAHRVSVPDDLWIVGYDDIEMAGWESFSLTTVRQPVREMAQLGVQLLLDRIEGRAQGEFVHERLPSELVIRASTGGKV